MASDSLAKFSDLLRYQLYECNDQQIPLSKEIAYLENFIELERLRQNANVKVSASIQPIFTSNLAIAPFIVLTFIENAFKHVSHHQDKPNWIDLKLTLQDTELKLWVSNSMARDQRDVLTQHGGIGLKNVQRRLDLLYPGQYTLDIQSANEQFQVHLRLMLTGRVQAFTQSVTDLVETPRAV